MRILYVEDDAQVRGAVAFALKCAGHLVHEVADCSTAKGIIEGTPGSFDLLISDIETPGELDGWDLAEVARGHAPALPVIYSTGASLDKARPVTDGRILRKPFTTAALLKHIESAPGLSRDMPKILPQSLPHAPTSKVRAQAAPARAPLAAAA